MHDDQHGTAIISAAALLNALEIAEKNIEDVRIVISGAGAAAVSCTRLYKAFGARGENIVMLDSKGVIRLDREVLSKEKEEFATARKIDSLDDAMKDADVFVGLSIADIVSQDMIRSMAKNPIVFAMANPDPEIRYNQAIEARKDIIMATGRSDHPNQVNNVLGFPFIFRGALDVRATSINEPMKMAAVKALAQLAKEPVPEQVNIAYGETRFAFGKDYIIPKPFDPRLITTVPPAVAKAAMESGVALEPIEDWEKYNDELLDRLGADNKIVRLLLDRARLNPKRIVFAESDQLDVLKAAQIVYEEGIAIPVLLGNRDVILELKEELDFDADVEIIDPKSAEEIDHVNKYAEVYWKARKRKGITLFDAQKLMRQRDYFAAMMVSEGDADGMLSGHSRSYPSVIKPVLEVIGPAKGVRKVAACNLMITSRGPLFLADTSINIEPSAKELAKIAQMTATAVKMFGLEPVVAMTSYANFGSSSNEKATKVGEAVAYLHRYYPDLIVDGEVQADFALNKEMLQSKFPFSKLAGKKVNTLVFSNIDSANITYKMIKELEKAENIGPIMLGMRKPVHVLQLGASVDEMVHMAAIAVIDAQKKEKDGL
jgi:malate dehydrogenase (oxaloacetate-decarboxylating)(NADP+)